MRTVRLLAITALQLLALAATAQVSVHSGTGTDPDASAMLDVQSTTTGVLVPRMTQAQRNAIATPAHSLMIYQTDNTPGYYYNSGTPGSPVWQRLFAGTGGPVTGTGTTDYLARWTSATALGIGAVRDNGTRVGIGAAPHGTYMLQVGGDVLLTSGSVRTTGSTGWVNETHGGGWHMADATWIRSSGNKGIYHNTGIMRTDGTFQVGGSGATFNVVNSGDLSYRTDVLFANTAGNVGIGTASPSTRLHVNGQGRIVKDAHTAGDNTYHMELYSPNTGSGANEVSLRFHQGNQYYAQLRYRSGGFRFTAGNTDALTAVSMGNLTANGTVTMTTLGVATNRLIQANAAGVLSASGLDPATIMTTANISGTTNYVARFTAANSIGNGVIQDNGTRIGVGTAPHASYRMQSNGDLLLTSGWLRTTGSTGWYNETHGGGWYMTDATWIRSYNDKSIYHNSGTMRTDGTFQVGGSGATLNVVNGGNFAYRTDVLFANTSNNVGIGTSAPTQRLDVNGQVRIRGGAPALGRVLVSDANGVGSWSNVPNTKPPTSTFTVDGSFDDYYPVVFQDASWADGPMELEIVRSSVHTNSSWRGSLQARFWSHASQWGHGSQFIDAQIHYGTNTFIAGYDYNPFSSQFVVWLRGGGTTYTMRSNNLTTVTDFSATAKTLTNGWAVGVKNAIDPYVNSSGHRVHSDFHVNGRIKTNAINETSDIRFKSDVQQVTDALEKVGKLRGVYYNWRTDEFPMENFGAGRQIGVIAQEIENVLPEVVATNEAGFKSVEYSHIVPLLIEAMKEQQDVIDELRTMVIDLQRHTGHPVSSVTGAEALLSE